MGVSSTGAGLVEWYVSAGSTLAGGTITGVNLNRSSGNVALATARSANTNVDGSASPGTMLWNTWIPAAGMVQDTGGSIILGYLDEISVNIVTDTDGCAAFFVGYYHHVG
jgi:hypothetical protein